MNETSRIKSIQKQDSKEFSGWEGRNRVTVAQNFYLGDKMCTRGSNHAAL